jgi:hypothetical protein
MMISVPYIVKRPNLGMTVHDTKPTQQGKRPDPQSRAVVPNSVDRIDARRASRPIASRTRGGRAGVRTALIFYRVVGGAVPNMESPPPKGVVTGFNPDATAG